MYIRKATECDQFIISDSSVIDITMDSSTNPNKIYANGIKLDSNTTRIISNCAIEDESGSKQYITHIHFNDKVDVTLNVETDNDSSTLSHKIGDDSTTSYRPCTKMIDHNTSFQLLRVNPKLTGNIKVVVDSDNNLYLDTFKVSKGLSQRKYRKIKINPNEYYGMSIMSQMKGLSSDDLYKIEDFCYSLFSSVNNIGESYYDTYNSGVRTNNDRLYKENYSLLAPLCVKKNVPDFFLIFKCKDIPKFTTDEDRLSYMIRNGNLIKSFDMRKDSDLGKYIHNINKKSEKYPGYIYLSYDYNEYNIYNGISIDRGVLSSHYEPTALERNIKNQVAMNDWYTLGFERNRIVAKDIINLEFMFDDPEEQVFSIANYFGFYVKLNGEDKDFSCIQSVDSFSSTKYTFDTKIKGLGFKPEDNMNVIYGFSEPNGFHRLRNNISEKVENCPINDYVMKPYKTILSSDIVKHDNDISYIKFKMDNVFEAGEHYRIINTNEHIIYDIIMSNYESSYDFSEISYDYYTENEHTYEIRKISVYNIGYRDESSVNYDLSHQLNVITNAFNKIGTDKLYAETNGIDSVSIIYKDVFDYSSETPSIIFQRVLSHCSKSDTTITNYINKCDKSCKILYQESSNPFIINDESNVHSFFNTQGLESLGKRLSFAVSFIPVSYKSNEICIFNDNLNDIINNYHSIIYKTKHTSENGKHTYNYTTSTDETNYIKTYTDGTWNTIKVPSIVGPGKNETHARFFPSGLMYPDTSDGVLRLYQNYPLNAGVCSIFPVKDFDTVVYDSISHISHNIIDGEVSDESGRYCKPDKSFGEIKISGEEEYICDYIDKYEIFKDYNSTSLDRDNNTLKKYIEKLLVNNFNKSDISLVVPYCCKWESTGTDSTGEHMRIMYPLCESKYTALVNSDSYYIPNDNDRGIGYISSSHEDAIKNPSKHISDKLSTKNHHNYRQYVTDGKGSLNDILHVDFANNISHDTNNKWSIVFSHDKNTIEFISGGVKIQLSSSNESIVNMSKYNGYSGILICMDGNNPLRENNIEVFIDETKSQIALIYYNGTASQDAIINYPDYGIGDFNNVIETDYIAHRLQFNQPLSNTKIDHNGEKLQVYITDDGDIRKCPCDNGKLFLSSPISNYDTYTEEKYNLIIADINDTLDAKNIEGYIAASKPIILSGSSEVETTNANITNELYKFNSTSDAFLITKNNSINKFQQLSNIKRHGTNIAVYVKTQLGTKNYSGKNSIISMSIIDPVDFNREDSNFAFTSERGLIHPTYCTPLFKDVFNFNYNDDDITSLSNTFETNFKGCNTIITSNETSVNRIPQMWIQKYVFNKNANEQDNNKSVSLGCIKNFSVLQSCFENGIYRTYDNSDNYSIDNGIDTGYEKNTFFGSRGLQLKTGTIDNTITITNWVDTIIDEHNKKIKLNVTESLINYIMFSEGFKSNWKRFKSTESVNKTKYIKNSILNHINLNDNCVFSLHIVDNSTIFKFFDYNDKYSFKKIQNSVNNLICENDTYYIELENLDTKTYSATLSIKL